MFSNLANWLVFFFSIGAYIPLAIGGIQHPEEINIASYGLWLILSVMLLHSSRLQGFAGWRMPFGFTLGNGALIILAFVVGGYTFNLGSVETVILYGLVATVSVWVFLGQITGKWNPRILFLGGVAADILSFYPQVKQYLQPHDMPTSWMLFGWGMWIMGALINIIFVEKMFQKLFARNKALVLILEESAFSLENGLFMIATVVIMVH